MSPVPVKERVVDIDAELLRETEGAYLIDDGVRQVWVPKSQVVHNDDGTFTMPEWLAIRKDLV